MTQVRFRDLPIVVRLTSAVSILSAWVLFEEYGIEANHWDRFLPYYRGAKFCPYDAAMIVLIVIFWVATHYPEADVEHS